MPSNVRYSKVFLAIAIATLGICSLSGCADSVLLFPTREPLNLPGAQQRFVDCGHRKIETYVARSPGAAKQNDVQAYVLEFCGNATRAEETAAASAGLWRGHPVEIWAVNYPGFGKSDGPASLRLLVPAALAVYDNIAARAAGRPIFLVGFSLGSAVALDVAVHRPVAGLILESPPPIQREIMEKFGWWNLWLLAGPIALQVPQELDSLSNGPNVHTKAIFVLTARDGIVPFRYQQMVCDRFAGQKHIYIRADADHNDHFDAQEQSRLASEIDWLCASGTGVAIRD
jgi:Alpha/beta hydrolase family